MKKIMIAAFVLFTSIQCFADPSQWLLMQFQSRFPSASTVRWSEDAKGYSAYWQEKDLTVRVFYDRDEKLELCMRNYPASRLPEKIQRAVKRDFKGFSVTSVTECSNENGVNYYLVIENEKRTKRVQYLADGSDYIIKEAFNKQVQ